METISKTNTIPEKIGGIVLVNTGIFQPQALMLKFLIYLILTMKYTIAHLWIRMCWWSFGIE